MTSFGKYQLVERLAAGGMAEVFRAKASGAAGFEKDLAIKRILPQFSSDEDFVKMFIDEARVAARLQHRNVVQIFDFDLADGSYYIAMELVDGCDLKKLARRGRLPIGVAMFVAAEALKGLGFAHAKQVVHRDVSPHNILISRAGEVKISDFGIAKAQARATATGSGVIKGKLSYMSPEQARGEPVDARADLFAVGVVLHELLTGARLFEGDSEMEILARVQRCEIAPPSQANPDVRPELDAVVLRLLAKAASARYASASEAVRALAAVPGYTDESETLALLVQEVAQPPPAATATFRQGEPIPLERGATVDSGQARAESARDRRLEPTPGTPRRATVGRGEQPPREADTGTLSRSVQPVSVVTSEARPSRARWLFGLLLVAAGGAGVAFVASRGSHAPVAVAVDAAPPARVAAAPPPDAAPPDAAPVAQVVAKPTHHKKEKVAPPPPTAPTLEPAPEPTGKGTLRVLVKPWANVVVDKKPIGQTPILDFELSAGPHTVELANDSRNETVKVSVGAGKLTEIKKDWTK